MSDNVIPFHGVTKLDIPVDRVLDTAKEAGLKKVVILGYYEDETEYYASSCADGGDIMWLLERCKQKLMG